MNTPYLLIQISILTLMLYLLSWLFTGLNIISKVFHRKLWNLLLLITFLITGILGILLAIQINYKLEWPIVKALLKWHVNFGIALAIIGTFHILWHSRYLLKMFKPEQGKSTKETVAETAKPVNLAHLKSVVLLSGFLSTAFQVLLIREFTTVFQGNELMMSWMLGTWMLLTGIGAFWGSSKINVDKAAKIPDKALIVLACIPLVLVPLLYILKPILFLPGIMVNPAYFLLIQVIFLTPVCLLCGFIYSILIKTYRSVDENFTKVYALEAVGSLAGGLVVSFVLVQWISVFQSLLVLLFLAVIIFAIIHKKTWYYYVIAIAFIIILSGVFSLNNRLKSFIFINQHVLDSKETYFGNITITENAGQYNFFGNGSLLYTTDNTMINEEYTHYALMQHPHPKDVLLVSGGIGGMISEILKYKSIENADYVELNPQLINMAAKYKPLPADKRVHILFDDGRHYIEHARKKYDVVIFAVPDPSSLQINRFYTNGFIAILKQKLFPGAVVLYSVSASGNYMSTEKIGIETTVYQTLKNNFRHVEIIPGERDYFVASDSMLRTDIGELSASKSIDTKYVNPYYIDDISNQQRGTFIKDNLKKEKLLDLDEKPLPVYYHILQFISEFTSKGSVLIAIPVIILLIPLFFMRSVAAGMYITGFTASSFEVLIIFTFQTFFGYVYSAIGIIIAIFMGGLALGSTYGKRFKSTKKHFALAQMLLVSYALLFPVFWNLQKETGNSYTGLFLFFIITLFLSTITGFQYVVGTKLLPGSFNHTAPYLYAVDLIGSSLGAIVISVFLLPLIGVFNSCFIIAGINLIPAIYNFIKKN